MKTPQAIKRFFRALLTAAFLLDGVAFAQWRSELYPENWQRPNQATSFYNDKLIQDFSYAGYKRGEQAIPSVTGPIYDAVSTYGADATGATDTTAAIQSAIDAAEAAGGGVVYLPAGTYKLSPQGANTYCLRIDQGDVVLRGAGASSTFLLNSSTSMRSKTVIDARGSLSVGSAVTITADLSGPTRRIPVATPATFAPGDMVRIEWSITDAWVTEHGQSSFWNATNGYPANAEYIREVLSVNTTEGWIEVDVPTRYTIKTRDNPVVRKITGLQSGIGIESLAIGNLQHSGTTWGENDYNTAGTGPYDAHASFLIKMINLRDCWITGVKSFQPSANTTTCHMLSNGIGINDSTRITLKDCWMGRPQFGGGGGNGYMYRIQYSYECLLQSCTADLSRHGFVISHAGTSGNVFLLCDDRETGRAMGATSTPYTTSGSGSDNHMHFSHSNLWDSCSAYNSFYTASHRGTSGTVPHGLTSAHAIYWNTSGGGTRYNDIVKSNQGRYGYVIGTSGSKFGVNSTVSNGTAPEDHVELVGTGGQLQPASLYLDQVERRLRPVVTYKGNGSDGGSVPTDGNNPYAPGDTVTILGAGTMTRTGFTFNGWNTMADGSGVDYAASSTFTIDNHLTLYAQWSNPNLRTATLSSKDRIIGIRQINAPALGYDPDASSDLVGTSGSFATETRYTANVVLGYSLPTLPVGTTVDTAVFRFEITANRDMGNVDPGIQVHLLDVANPDTTGDTYFHAGPTDSNPNTHLVGSTNIAVGNSDVSYADDLHDQSYPLTDGVLDVLRSYYGGDHIPERSEVFFRFSLDTAADISNLDRYRIDLASNESSLEILAAPPFDIWAGGGGVSFSGDSNGDGIEDGLAWLLDSSGPAAPAHGLLPTSQQSTGDLVAAFRLLKSTARGNALLKLQYSKDLGITDLWSDNTVTVPDATSTVGAVSFVITPSTSEDYNQIQATIPASAAAGGPKLFMRLLAEP